MCNRYDTPRPQDIANQFQLQLPLDLTTHYSPSIGPRNNGPYVRSGRLEVGQWALLPDKNPDRIPRGWNGKPINTNNCRMEGMTKKSPTFRAPWARGQRCLIPAVSFDEPYWGGVAGKNIWWRFRRADGALWALAGLYNDWIDPATGEVVHSYTMITTNADSHPLISLMHKHDPKAPDDQQDKRSVVAVEHENWAVWLSGTFEQALTLVQPPRMDVIAHAPADPAITEQLPV
jgi:putative SOS response-associated peptidase YedK